jgi:hypothetical protein
MPHKRAHIILPEELLTAIDSLVGQRGRSAFLVEVLQQEVDRRRLLQILGNPEPILKEEDYSEFRDGSEDWVRQMRDQELRLENEKLGNWMDTGKLDQ